MTNEQLAEALGLNVRTIERDRLRGLPLPADGEDLAAWATRAKAWRKSTRKRPGPRPTATAGDSDIIAMTRYRVAKAELAELQLAERRAQLHSKEECESVQVRRYQEMCNAFASIGDALARRLYQQSPDAIKVIVEEEVWRRLEIVAAGKVASDGPVDASAAPGHPAT